MPKIVAESHQIKYGIVEIHPSPTPDKGSVDILGNLIIIATYQLVITQSQDKVTTYIVVIA